MSLSSGLTYAVPIAGGSRTVWARSTALYTVTKLQWKVYIRGASVFYAE